MSRIAQSLSNFVVILGLPTAPSGAVPKVYEPRKTAVVRTAKAWDSPLRTDSPAYTGNFLELAPSGSIQKFHYPG